MNRFPADSVKGLPLARGMVIDDVPFLDAWLRDYLRKARLKAGLTQERLARSFQLHQSWVAKVELGERRLTTAECLLLCDRLQLDPREVMSLALEALAAHRAIRMQISAHPQTDRPQAARAPRPPLS